MAKAYVIGVHNYRHYCVEEILKSNMGYDRQERTIRKLPSNVSYDLYKSISSILESDMGYDRQERAILSLCYAG